MDLFVPYLRLLAPWISTDAGDLRRELDLAGIEVKSITDTVASVELLANRGDHRSYEGVIRELAAHVRPRGGSPVAELAVDYADDRTWSSLDSRPNDVDQELCLAYELLSFRIGGHSSAAWTEQAATVLALGGVDPEAHPVVVATNLVNLEIGQPLHAFDADTLHGRLHVRRSRQGERILLIGESEARVLPAGLGVIADDLDVVAVAGVMGGQATSMSESTTSVLIEAACFAPAEIRRSAQHLKLSTLASQRFERGADPKMPRRALRRLVSLLDTVEVRISDVRSGVMATWSSSPAGVSCSAVEVNRLLGTSLVQQEIDDYLRWFGFERATNAFAVPSWRIWDVEEAADLIEEVAQAITYDALPEFRPVLNAGALPGAGDVFKASAERALVSCGFFEVFGDTFHDETAASLLRGLRPSIDDDYDDAYVRLVNSVDPRHGLLRRSAMVTAADVIHTNLNGGVPAGSVFEWARVFSKDATTDWGLTEKSILWFAGFNNASSASTTFEHVKGAVEAVASQCSLDLRVARCLTVPSESAFHANQTAVILQGDSQVGVIGGLTAIVVENLGLKAGSVVYAELDLRLLTSSRPATVERPPRPVRSTDRMRRQLSFLCLSRVDASDIVGSLEEAASRSGKSVTLAFDSAFEDAEGRRSVTISIDLDRREWASREDASAFASSLGVDAVSSIGPDRIALRSAE